MTTLEDQIRATFERVAAQTLVNPAPSFKMLDRTPVQPSQEEPALIDLKTPSHTDEHQKRALVAGLLAAAAIVLVLTLGAIVRVGDEPDPADVPTSPIPTAPTTIPATVPESVSATSGGMWPQSTLEEVRAAQERADAGDPDYTWQIEPQLTLYEDFAIAEPGQVELVDRFLREVLGWEDYLIDPHRGFPDVQADGALPDQRIYRCAPGRTNPLYPPGPQPKLGELCAPTIDDLNYESVSVDLAQLDRTGDGIWVVNRWELTSPFAQADPAVVEAEGTERLEEFLAARVAGSGAEGYVEVYGYPDVPLLYAATSGAAYERYEIERVEGLHWPDAGMTFSARLYANGGATVVEQQFGWVPSFGLSMDINSTRENGQPITLSYTSFDGEVTVSAPSTWDTYWPDPETDPRPETARPAVWFGMLWPGSAPGYFDGEEGVGFVDPVAYDAWCAAKGGSPLLTAPADAAGIAQQVAADPDLVTTVPVAAHIGGLEALSIDVTLAPGGRTCGVAITDISRWIHVLREPGPRLRLYLVDLPEGMSVQTLAITVVAPEERFDDVIAETAPIIESIEFHPQSA
jgi:hypothetical protein